MTVWSLYPLESRGLSGLSGLALPWSLRIRAAGQFWRQHRTISEPAARQSLAEVRDLHLRGSLGPQSLLVKLVKVEPNFT